MVPRHIYAHSKSKSVPQDKELHFCAMEKHSGWHSSGGVDLCTFYLKRLEVQYDSTYNTAGNHDHRF
jgi:hypothetical protein